MATDPSLERQTKEDLRRLRAALKKDGLDPDEMFAKRRGIRSVTPPFNGDDRTGGYVHQQIRRIKPPKTE